MRVRPRFQVSFNQCDEDAELIDYLYGASQEKKRQLFRAGFSLLIKHMSTNASIASSADPEMMATLTKMLAGGHIGQFQQQAPQQTHNGFYQEPQQGAVHQPQVGNSAPLASEPTAPQRSVNTSTSEYQQPQAVNERPISQPVQSAHEPAPSARGPGVTMRKPVMESSPPEPERPRDPWRPVSQPQAVETRTQEPEQRVIPRANTQVPEEDELPDPMAVLLSRAKPNTSSGH
jgi:hypothetical protein